MADLIDKQSVVDIAMCYCPDDDGSCSKADADIRELLDEIENLQAVNCWIPCSERMPERDSGCYPCVFIVWNDLQPDCAGIYSAYPHIGFYNWRMKGWQDDSGNVYFDSDGYVTHWFPMPAVPLFPKQLKEGADN